MPLASGTIATVTLGITCSTNTTPLVEPLPFSTAPAPSFGNTAGQSVPGTVSSGSIDILPGLRGDCNGDGRVDAGDLTACGLEIFDGDGSFWLDVPGGSFPGIPVGCDSEADIVVDAGDLACKIRIIYGQSCAAPAVEPPSSLAPPTLPGLAVGAAEAAAGAGGTLKVPILFDHPRRAQGGPRRRRGQPAPPATRQAARDQPPARHGPPAQAIALGSDPPPPFGKADGSSAAGALSILFFDGFESGTPGAWSAAVP